MPHRSKLSVLTQSPSRYLNFVTFTRDHPTA
uniref:Uncharacterized protein n=1 Tax=Arundo donax TaxID=35708 RepID=A0A0A9EU35_ARUDO